MSTLKSAAVARRRAFKKKKQHLFLFSMIFSFVFLHAFICSAVSHPVDG